MAGADTLSHSVLTRLSLNDDCNDSGSNISDIVRPSCVTRISSLTVILGLQISRLPRFRRLRHSRFGSDKVLSPRRLRTQVGIIG